MARTMMDSAENTLDSGQKSTTLNIDGQDRVELPSSDYVADAKMTRDGPDLMLTAPDGSVVVVEGYFNADPAPLLISADGSALTPDLVKAFAKSPYEFAANNAANDESPVGSVEEVQGNATVIRTDGSVETITAGTKIYQGDVIETDASGAVNIVFIDETSMAVSQNARLAIDEYTFDPSTESGTTNFSVLRGLFVFTSGLIGRDDPDDVSIDTPVGSIGIRGTVIAGEINPGGDSNISVLEGAIVVKNGSMETTLSNQFETVKLGGYDEPMRDMGVVPAADISNKFSNVGNVLPSLFSVINDAAHEQGSQPQQNQTAPQPNSEPEAKLDPAKQQDAAPQQNTAVQESKVMAIAPDVKIMAELMTLSDNSSGLKNTQTALGSAVEKSLAGISTQNGQANVAPLIGIVASASGIAGQTNPLVDLISKSPILQTPPVIKAPHLNPLEISYTLATFKDTADAGTVVVRMAANAPGIGVNFTFGNDSDVSANGFFRIVGNTVQLTDLGAHALDQSLSLVQLGGFAIVAHASDGRTSAPQQIIPDLTDASHSLELNASTPGVTLITDNLNNKAGFSISALGDQNRDGFDDLIFSNDTANTTQNHIYKISGSNTILSDTSLPLLTTTILNPAQAGNTSQTIVAGVGDFNGDGIQDYVIGQANGKIGTATESGSAFIVSGLNSIDTISFTGTPQTGDGFGTSVSGAGDFNNDGYADVLIGAPNLNSGVGGVFLIKGGESWTADVSVSGTSSNSTLYTGSGSSHGYGETVKGIGDINGDGFSDFAVGTSIGAGGNGTVEINYGHKTGISTPSSTIITGSNGQHLGAEISALGDINGDGFSDILIGTESSTSPGTASNTGKIILGSATGSYRTINFDFGDEATYKLTGAGGIGDFDGDGYDDFALSLADGNESRIYVVYGQNNPPSTTDITYLKSSGAAMEFIYNGADKDNSLEISAVGDLNGDGRDDFAIGVTDANGAEAGNGGLFVIYGRDSGNVPSGNLTATANAQSLIGNSSENILNDNGFNLTSFNGGASSDTIKISNTNFLNIDGGGSSSTSGSGDSIVLNNGAGGLLDFKNVNFEKISGIEKISFGSDNQTLVLTLENIFNFMKSSDSYTAGGTTFSGVLKISDLTNSGAKLIIDTDPGNATDLFNGTSTVANIDAVLETISGSGKVASTQNNNSGDGEFHTFKIGGYALMIENTIQVDVQ